MENTNMEETLDNLGEPIPTEEPTQVTQEQPKEESELERQNKQLYARAKKAEEDLKKLQEFQKANQGSSGIDPLEITRLGKSLSQYSDDETDMIIERAKGKFGTLNPNPQQIKEAATDEWTQLAINAKREKVAKEQSLAPSSKQEMTDRPKSVDEFISTASEEEVEKWMVDQGLWKPPHRRHNPKAFNSNY